MAQSPNLNFHMTFRPETQYIAAILEIAEDNSYRSIKEISSLTGIPAGEFSGKVEPHIIYSYYMGLIEYERKDGEFSLKRTKLGECIYREDPGLQEELSILLCHCMMQREAGGAAMWATAFKKILPLYRDGITKEMLVKELNAVFDGKVTTKNIAPFYGSYDSFFDSLGLIEESKEYIKVIPHSYNKEFKYLYAFVLFQYWGDLYPNQDEITSEELNNLCFGKVFGWNSTEEYDVLEQLSDCDLIRMNRQLMPYTILKLVDKDSLINLLFSELF